MLIKLECIIRYKNGISIKKNNIILLLIKNNLDLILI